MRSELAVVWEVPGARLEGSPSTREITSSRTHRYLARNGHSYECPDWGERASFVLECLMYVGAKEFLVVARFNGQEIFLTEKDLHALANERRDTRLANRRFAAIIGRICNRL